MTSDTPTDSAAKPVNEESGPSVNDLFLETEAEVSRRTRTLRWVGWALIAVPIALALFFVLRGKPDTQLLAEKIDSEGVRIESQMQGRLTAAVASETKALEDRLASTMREAVRTEVRAAFPEALSPLMNELEQRIVAIEESHGDEASPGAGDPQIGALRQRLDELSRRIDELPTRTTILQADEQLASDVETIDDRVGSLESELDSVEESMLGEIKETASALNRKATASLPFIEGGDAALAVPQMSLMLRPGVLRKTSGAGGSRRYSLAGFALADGSGNSVFPTDESAVELDTEHEFRYQGCEHRFTVHHLKKKRFGRDRLLLNIGRGNCSGAA